MISIAGRNPMWRKIARQNWLSRKYTYPKFLLLLTGVAFCLASCVGKSETRIASTLTPTTFPTVRPTLSNEWASHWLKGIPCRPPCWEGITPGQTSAADAVEILKRNPLVATAQAQTDSGLPNLGSVSWILVNGQRGGEASYSAQDTALLISSISPSFVTPFQLSEVIQAYGEPSHVIAFAYQAPDNSLKFFYELSIIYLSQGIALFSGGSIKPDSTKDGIFSSVVFFIPTMNGLATIDWRARDHPEWVLPWRNDQSFDYFCRDTVNGRACRGQ